jgi:hypothetical protein
MLYRFPGQSVGDGFDFPSMGYSRLGKTPTSVDQTAGLKYLE